MFASQSHHEEVVLLQGFVGKAELSDVPEEQVPDDSILIRYNLSSTPKSEMSRDQTYLAKLMNVNLSHSYHQSGAFLNEPSSHISCQVFLPDHDEPLKPPALIDANHLQKQHIG
jgi:hypothetical protein